MDSQAQLSDIQTYLATFNPKEQGQIILQPDGSFIKGEDQAQMDDGSGLEPQPLLTPAAPSMGDDQQLVMAPSDQTGMLVTQAASGDAGADNAVQVLANVAATSIPQLSTTQQQIVTMQTPSGATQQMVAVSGGVAPVTSLPTSSSVQIMAQAGGSGGVVAAQDSAGEQNAVLGRPGANPFSTVTVVPSEVSGEVSYVLIVSNTDKDAQGADGDPSVYDFNEEGNATFERGEQVGPVDVNATKKIIKVTQKRPPHAGLQSQLMCNYCNYTSPKRYLLTRHMKTHSEERPHKCTICDRGFKTVASLQNHINTHTGVRPQKCKECDAAFTTSGELVRHVRYRHTFEKPHKCTECDYASVELSKLKRHMRSHTGERPYQCPHCSYASPDTFKLKRHLRIHTGEKPYECDVCNMRFTQSNSLKAHKLIHTGNKPVFQCELCPTTCGRKTDLKIHVQKLHTSDKPLQCKKCGKSFPDRYTYKIHLKTHEGEKCFKCELCPYAALSQRHLESHILTHTGEKPFQCDECDQSFRQKQLLRRHKNLYHTPDYVPPAPKEKSHECSECNKVFAHRGNLLRHMALHDPENPANKDLLAEAEEEDQAEDYEEEDITLDTPGPLIQTVLTDQGMQQIVMQQSDALRVPGQQIQLQLVTADGESAGQILLQMSDDGTAQPQIEVQQQQPTMLQLDPSQLQQQQQLIQQQVLQQEDEDEEPEPEDLPEDEEEEEEEEEMMEEPEAITIATPKRGRGRPPKAQLIMKADEADETPLAPRKRGRPRKQVAEELVDEEEDEEEEEAEDEEDEESEEEALTPRKRKRTRGSLEAVTPGKRTRVSPKKKVNTEDEQQKKKDIEECFGFNMD